MDKREATPNTPADRRPKSPRPAWLLWLLLAASVLTLLVMAELSPGGMAWMRVNWEFFNWPMSRIEWLELRTGLNVQHILVFAWIALLLRIVWPTPRWHWPWGLIMGLAIFIELAQFLSPGRTPRLTDIRDDLLGAGIGWCVGGLMLSIARRLGALLRRSPAVIDQSERPAADARGDPP